MRWLRSLIGTSVTDGGCEHIFRGLSVSGGVAVGLIHVLHDEDAVSRRFQSAEEETEAFRSALETAKGQLETLIASQDKLAADILEFQLALLDDDDMLAPVYQAIESGTPCGEAWARTLDGEITEYRDSGEATLSARADDLTDLRDRVMRVIYGSQTSAEQVPEKAIVVTAELTPSAFLDLDWNQIGGAAILGGSPTSHVSILARARGVNLIVGLDADISEIERGVTAIIDAVEGALTVQPSFATLASVKARIIADEDERKTAAALLPCPAVTAQGEAVKILVNIDEPDRLGEINVEHCDGVGLTRTEFLFKDGHQPQEEEQLAFYRRLIEWADGRPVTIRTLDAGGDKPIPGVTIDGETNPFLGVRGLRLSLARPELFRVQLRALARAAACGPVNVMFPMVTVPEELAKARQMMMTEVTELEHLGVPWGVPRMGMMVEVPVAALTAGSFDVDFYSIGSNDLIQYATACARDNASLAALADPLNPAVIELIKRTVDAGRERGVDVSLCGDMASSPHLIAPLLDTGLRALSCAPAQTGAVKLAVSRYGQQPEEQIIDG